VAGDQSNNKTSHPSSLIWSFSQKYVRHIVSCIPKLQVHLSTPVVSIRTHHEESSLKVELEATAGVKVMYDHVIMACHSDETLRILRQGLLEKEEEILSKFRWNRNSVVLHCDSNVIETTCFYYGLTVYGSAHAKATFSLVLLELHHFEFFQLFPV
jgi:hypothetical protein